MKLITPFFLAAVGELSCGAAESDRTVITSSEPVPAGKSTVRFGIDTFGIDTFGVGMDTGSSVSNTYQPPFAFTGTIQEVRVELK
jgi:hypothetical protein